MYNEVTYMYTLYMCSTVLYSTLEAVDLRKIHFNLGEAVCGGNISFMCIFS